MSRLEDVPVVDLEEALENATRKRETMRLMTAVIYKRGPSVPMLAEWLDVRAAIIYGWFDRLESEPVAAAVRDRSRPGRPPRLTDDQRQEFRDVVSDSPAKSGYDADAWTVTLAQQYLEDRFDVEYSSRHVRRLLDSPGSPG